MSDFRELRCWKSSLGLRCKVVGVAFGPTRVTLRARAEQDPFTLETSDEIAQALIPIMASRDEIDIEAQVRRYTDGIIADGTLYRFHTLSKEDPIKALRDWYKAIGEPWKDVEDVEAELHRIRYGDDSQNKT